MQGHRRFFEAVLHNLQTPHTAVSSLHVQECPTADHPYVREDWGLLVWDYKVIHACVYVCVSLSVSVYMHECVLARFIVKSTRFSVQSRHVYVGICHLGSGPLRVLVYMHDYVIKTTISLHPRVMLWTLHVDGKWWTPLLLVVRITTKKSLV